MFAGRKAGPAKIKAPTMNDFQFFDRARIEAIVAKENSFVQSRRDLQLKLKEAKSKESKEQKRFVKQRATEILEANPSAAEGTSIIIHTNPHVACTCVRL